MIRLALAVTALICFAVPFPTNAEEGERPLSIKGLNQPTTRLYMEGVAHGFGVYDAALFLSGKPQLYCAPLSEPINGKFLFNLASNALEGPHRPEIVAMAALDELTKMYPC